MALILVKYLQGAQSALSSSVYKSCLKVNGNSCEGQKSSTETCLGAGCCWVKFRKALNMMTLYLEVHWLSLLTGLSDYADDKGFVSISVTS